MILLLFVSYLRPRSNIMALLSAMVISGNDDLACLVTITITMI